MNQSPLVSTVMTSYRDPAPVLRRAIDSILAQTVGDLELVITFEPGDANADWVRQNVHDDRVVVVINPSRYGMAKSFNHGLDMARGRYIARMDSDDYAHPDRFEKELNFLNENPDIAVVGSAGNLVDESGTFLGLRSFPLTHHEIIRAFAFINPMLHPTVMWDRTRLGFDVRYDPEALTSEDCELWLRLLGRGYRFANLAEPLIDYCPPIGYRRPKSNWRGNFVARRKNILTAFKYPSVMLGLMLIGILASLPLSIVNALTQRSWLSDRFRSIAPGK